jgi:hypothetical protein
MRVTAWAKYRSALSHGKNAEANKQLLEYLACGATIERHKTILAEWKRQEGVDVVLMGSNEYAQIDRQLI